MAAPTIAASSSDKTGNSADGITVTFASDGPSGIVDGSLLVAHVAFSPVPGQAVALNVPSGWTKVTQSDINVAGGAAAAAIFVRLCDGTETSVVFTVASGDTEKGMTAKVWRIAGHASSDFINTFAATTANINTNVITVDGVTTTVDECFILYGSSNGGLASVQTCTWTDGPTEISDFGTDPGVACDQSTATKTQTIAGATGDATATWSGGDGLTGMCVAIAPAVVTSTGLTAGTESADQSSYATASITPTHRALILASVLNTKAANADLPTITGCNLTWVRIRTITFGPSAGYRITLFRAMSPANDPPTTGTLTIAFGGVAQTGCTWAVNEFSGVNTGGSNGSGAVRNDAGNTSTATGTDLTVTLPQIQSPNNITFGAFGFIDNAAVTPGTGYEEIAEEQDTLPDRTLFTEFQQGRDRTVDATGPSVAASGISGIAIEIRASNQITSSGLDSGSDPTLKTSYTTNSITPSADALILMTVYNSRANQATLPTISGCNLTWVLVSSSTFNVNGTQRLSVFRAMSSTPDPGVLTIDFDGVGQLACQWSLVEFHNVDTSGSNGENALGKKGTAGGGQDTSTSLLVTLADFASSSNATYGAFGVDAEDAITPGSGLTEIHSVTDATATQALLTERKLSEDTTVDASWPTSTFAAAFGSEIVAEPESVTDDTPASPSEILASGTPTLRVIQVSDYEDFRVYEVESNSASTISVQVVTEEEQADARVRVVTRQSLAEEFARVVEGEFTSVSVVGVANWDDGSATWDSSTAEWDDI